MKLLNLPKQVFLLLLVTSFISCNSNKFNYSVKEYILTLEPRENGTDLNVSIDITYLIDDTGDKSDGFKFVGNGVVDSLKCSDETGIIRGDVEYLRDTKVSWYFSPVRACTKKINAKFILRDYIFKQDNSLSELNVPWAGVFRVAVEQAKYVIVIHKANTDLRFAEPENWKHEIKDSIDYYSNVQAPLKDKIIKVQLVN